MTWRTEKTDEGQDLVWDGVENGIAPSPTRGTANIQNANISTELGEIMASFGRTAQQQAAISNGTLTPDGATLFDAPANLKAGSWIRVSASTVSSISVSAAPSSATASYLLVAGGGAGGPANTTNSAGGGGGAGELVDTTASFSVGTYAITIGAGGIAASTIGPIGDGDDSIIAGIDTAVGGGSGGRGATTTTDGRNGASGGGGGGVQSTPTIGNGGTGSAGNDGGVGSDSGIGGGGGGAGADGAAAGANGGNGGVGVASSISGTSTYYAGGGGGGYDSGGGSAGSGGNGGGGAGGKTAGGTAGTANTGGGGGGAGTTGATQLGGDGGSGIAIISYDTNSMTAQGGTITRSGTKTIHTFTGSGVFEVLSIAETNLYYVSYSSGGKIKLSAKFDPYEENELTHGTTGSITFSVVATPGAGIAKATEKYGTATNTEYRYYVLDNQGYVWVFDSAVYETNGTLWMLPDPSDYSDLLFTGMAVLNGWLFCLNSQQMYSKPTVDLGSLFIPVSNSYFANSFPNHINFAYTSDRGVMYYTDGNFIGSLYPTNEALGLAINVQSYCQYTASTTTGTVSVLLNGSLPYTIDGNGDTVRIPAVFFTDVYGTAPTNLLGGNVYWIEYSHITGTFAVYADITGGSAINIATGAAGKQYFNTLGMFGDAGINGAETTVLFTQQRVNLPSSEVAQCIIELGNTVLIGGKSNVLYPWNQIDATPSDFIYLPEADVKTMINVNNMAYVFAGYKGNIYICNSSVASLVLKVPDYVAGVPGTPLTYIEPVFTWFDAIYMRGRIYFSMLDQTATKAGNTGGVWSFVPSQNFYFGQDIGLSLRLENQNSYGDYDGAARLLIANEEQQIVAPQYWAWWQDSYSTATSAFGIDYTASTPVTTFTFETDLLPTGTLLSKDTFTQLEYKLTTPLAVGDSVQLYYRLNATNAWTSCGTTEVETNDPISGYYSMAFQKTQWIQFRAVCTTPGTTASSFIRLRQIRLR